MGLKRGSTPIRTGLLTVSRNMTWPWTSLASSHIPHILHYTGTAHKQLIIHKLAYIMYRTTRQDTHITDMNGATYWKTETTKLDDGHIDRNM
jgi:hypothetical protein